MGESIIERDLVNDARVTDTLKQITRNIQKTNMDISWREVSDNKKNRNNSQKINAS